METGIGLCRFLSWSRSDDGMVAPQPRMHAPWDSRECKPDTLYSPGSGLSMVHRRAPSNTIVVMVDGQEGPSTRTTKPRNLSSTRAHAIQLCPRSDSFLPRVLERLVFQDLDQTCPGSPDRPSGRSGRTGRCSGRVFHFPLSLYRGKRK